MIKSKYELYKYRVDTVELRIPLGDINYFEDGKDNLDRYIKDGYEKVQSSYEFGVYNFTLQKRSSIV
jgi:hypothetical protein